MTARTESNARLQTSIWTREGFTFPWSEEALNPNMTPSPGKHMFLLAKGGCRGVAAPDLSLSLFLHCKRFKTRVK